MSDTVSRNVSVYPKQAQFLNSTALYRAFVGGIGSGKSWIGSLDLIRRSKPNRLYLVTAPTYPMLSDATFRSLTGLALKLGALDPADIRSSPPQSIKLLTGAEVIFRSTDNPETLRGPNLSGIWMDEASLSDQRAFDILIGRLREEEQGWLSATFTPKGKSHWTYKVFGTGDPETELIHATSEENFFLPKGFVERVRKRYTKAQSDQELSGLFLEGAGNHYYPHLWPKYVDVGDAYRIHLGEGTQSILKSDCSMLLALDWAMGKPKNDAKSKAARASGLEELTGDHTAFVVADLSPEGLLFLRYALCERIPLAENAERLAEVCRRWRPVVVAGDDDNLSEAMVLETRRYADIPLTKPMALGGRNKLVRSQAAIVRAERGMVYLPSDIRYGGHPVDMSWVEMLSDQLSTFTGADGEPDDLADAVSILGRLADEFVPGTLDDDYESLLGSEGWDGGGIW